MSAKAEIAAHQTSHNSGVVHSGIYYAPKSLKADLCVRGSAALHDFCAEHEIRIERCGKLIVATSPAELSRLDELERRGRANGVRNLRRITASDLSEIEPHVSGISGLHSPETGIVDFSSVARALAADIAAMGGSLVTECSVERMVEEQRGVTVTHSLGQLRASFVIVCAGLWSDRLATASGAPADPRIVPFRGGIYSFARSDASWCGA